MADNDADRKIAAALALRLKSLTPAVRTQYENAPKITPVPTEPYLTEHYLPARTAPVGLAFDSSDNHAGVYQVTIYAPRDAYKAVGHTLIGALRTLFARGTFLSAEGLRVLVENTYAGNGQPIGDRWAIPVSVEWRAFA